MASDSSPRTSWYVHGAIHLNNLRTPIAIFTKPYVIYMSLRSIIRAYCQFNGLYKSATFRSHVLTYVADCLDTSTALIVYTTCRVKANDRKTSATDTPRQSAVRRLACCMPRAAGAAGLGRSNSELVVCRSTAQLKLTSCSKCLFISL